MAVRRSSLADTGEADLVVAGGGPAGMMAGLLFARAGLKTVVLEKHDEAVDTTATSNRWNQQAFGVSLNVSNFVGQVLVSDRFTFTPDKQFHAGGSFQVDRTERGTHILYAGGSVTKISPVYAP